MRSCEGQWRPASVLCDVGHGSAQRSNTRDARRGSELCQRVFGAVDSRRQGILPGEQRCPPPRALPGRAERVTNPDRLRDPGMT